MSTTLRVSKETWRKLSELKMQWGLRRMDDVISRLLSNNALLERIRIASILCFNYRESKATASAWVNILKKEELPLDAFTFLKPVSDEDFIVNLDMCRDVLGLAHQAPEPEKK